MPALIDAARMNQAAQAMTDKFVSAVAAQAGVPKRVVNSMLGYGDSGATPDAVTGAAAKLGTDLVTSLTPRLQRLRRAPCPTSKTNLTTPIIRAFDDATAAVERLIDAIKRLAAMNANRPAVAVAVVVVAAVRRNGRRCWRRCVHGAGMSYTLYKFASPTSDPTVCIGDSAGVWLHTLATPKTRLIRRTAPRRLRPVSAVPSLTGMAHSRRP